jgi:endonuclease III
MEVIPLLLERLGGRFAAELEIDVASGPAARQQWFLAAILYGARIAGSLAERTYKVLAARGVVTPEAVLAQGWDGLVALLDEGGYARYDFKTATKLLGGMESLKDRYQGDLERLHETARDYEDLEALVRDLAPGIGPATANIFLRELRGVWAKATPPLSSLAQLAAAHAGLIPPEFNGEAALAALLEQWERRPVQGRDFADLEAALVRLGRDYCRHPGGRPCPLAGLCPRSRT